MRLMAVVCVFTLSIGSVVASDWPGFRGSRGGIADDADLPVKFTADNILWKIKLPGAGTSSPIITGDKLFLTCNAGYGTSITKGMIGGGGGGKGGGAKGGKGGDGGDQAKLKLLVVCLDRAKGEILWKKEIEPKLPETPFSGMMREHSYASATPVTDGKNVYVFFGKTGVFAFDLEGKKLWQADVGSSKHMWGSAASPVLYKDLLFVNAAIESKSIVALNKNTGAEVWRQSGLGTTWASPVLVETKAGKHELVLNIPGKVVAYDPDTGKELWHCQGVGAGGGGSSAGGGFGGGGASYTASTPVAKDGVVYVIGGGGPTPAVSFAVKTGGKGDVTKTHILWKQKTGACNCSPVLTGDYLCWVDGSVTCVNIADGKIAYKERLYSAKNEYVSAVAADGKIYALTRSDGLFVLAGGGTFQQLARNDFKADTSVFNASPAVSDGRIYLRSNEYLYCIGKK
jgi:outer membrane protein assembly factor BamB